VPARVARGDELRRLPTAVAASERGGRRARADLARAPGSEERLPAARRSDSGGDRGRQGSTAAATLTTAAVVALPLRRPDGAPLRFNRSAERPFAAPPRHARAS